MGGAARTVVVRIGKFPGFEFLESSANLLTMRSYMHPSLGSTVS